MYRAITGRTKINLKHIVADFSAAMRTLDIVMAHPSPQDVIELSSVKADEKIQAFALDGADKGLGECIGVRGPVRDLDDLDTFRFPDGIEHGAEFGVGISDQEARRNPLFLTPHQHVAGLLGYASEQASACRSRAWLPP